MKNKERTRIERNISFLEGRPLPYQMIVTRHHQNLIESYYALEEAIFARDEIESNYRETGKLEHSSIYEPGHLKNARRRYLDDNVRKATTNAGRVYYSIETTCKQCGLKHTYRSHEDYHRFLDRDERCTSCFSKDRHDELMDARNSSDKPNSTNKSTGVKNISFDNRLSKYHVMVYRKGHTFSKRTRTLDEAIVIKERVLDFYKEFDRLPNQDEI